MGVVLDVHGARRVVEAVVSQQPDGREGELNIVSELFHHLLGYLECGFHQLVFVVLHLITDFARALRLKADVVEELLEVIPFLQHKSAPLRVH